MCVERRQGERRQGDRRSVSRGGADRRQGDRRRAAEAVGALAVTAVLVQALPAEAQIYTRTNARGVMEATNMPEPAGGYELTYPKRLGVVIHSREFRLRPSSNTAYDEHIDEAAARFDVSVELVRAVIQTESAFDRLAVSSVGARGLMQLMPATARRFGVEDSFDARQNIFGGVKYLRVLLDMFSGDVALAAAGYNAGENAVKRHGGVPPYPETRQYVRKVQGLLAGGHTVPDVPSLTPGAGSGAVRTAAAARTARPRTLYRWLDADGTPHLSDTPPAGRSYVTIRGTD